MIQNKKKDNRSHSAFETEDYYMLRTPSKSLNYFNDLSKEDEDKLFLNCNIKCNT